LDYFMQLGSAILDEINSTLGMRENSDKVNDDVAGMLMLKL